LVILTFKSFGKKFLKKEIKNIVSFKKGCKFAAAKNGNEFSKKFMKILGNNYVERVLNLFKIKVK